MQRPLHSAEIIKERLAASAAAFMAALFLWFCCIGCVRQRVRIQALYHLEDNDGFPMLVPTFAGKMNPGLSQTSVVLLRGVDPKGASPSGSACTINGEIFSMWPGVPADRAHWMVRSPSVSGWNALRTDTDIDARWKTFNRDLMVAQERGCFPSDLSIYSIRAAIAKTIPMPADEVPSFLYADAGENFINLVPGMRISIQQVDATANLSQPKFRHSQLSVAEYEIISRSDGAVSLRLRYRRNTEQRREPQPGAKEMQIGELSERFTGESVLRLLLEGFSGAQSDSGAVLLGATDAAKLDTATEIVRSRGAGVCSQPIPNLLCVELPHGSVSIFSIVWVNGHRRAEPFGTSLEMLLTSLPPSEQSKALESIRVFRQLARDDYAEIRVPGTLDGAREVLLVPDDRVQWRP